MDGERGKRKRREVEWEREDGRSMSAIESDPLLACRVRPRPSMVRARQEDL